jgi:hypothetical protein
MPKTGWKQADGRVTSVDSIATRGRRELIVTFTYNVEGHPYKSKFYTFDSIQEGASLVVEYDVSNRMRNNFESGQKRINGIAFAVALPLVIAALLLLWFSLKR